MNLLVRARSTVHAFMRGGPSQIYNVYYLFSVQLLDKAGVPLYYKLKRVKVVSSQLE